MRDASHINWHRIRIDIASLDLNLAIMNGAQQEVDSRRRNNVSGRGVLGRGRANSRGRGGSTSRNVSVVP
jgi:hypothetical protein